MQYKKKGKAARSELKYKKYNKAFKKQRDGFGQRLEYCTEIATAAAKKAYLRQKIGIQKAHRRRSCAARFIIPGIVQFWAIAMQGQRCAQCMVNQKRRGMRL